MISSSSIVAAPGLALRLCRRSAAASAITFMLAAAPAVAAGNDVTVTIANFTFTPNQITIAPGTTVTWVNEDDIPHTVVATEGTFRSRPLDTDDRYSFTFREAGDFAYFCSLHPHMTGKVTVKVDAK